MLKLIIIDDEKLTREGLVGYIDWNALGVEVSMTYANGRDALEHLEETAPDIIISDIRMPKMDGIELIKQVKSLKYPCEVIFISAYRNFDYAKEAVKYGAFDYILKPIQKDVLRETVTRCAAHLSESKSPVKDEALIKKERQKDLSLCLLSSPDDEADAGIAGKLGISEESGATLAIVRFEDPEAGNLSEDDALDVCRSLGVFSGDHTFIAVKLVDHEALVFAFEGDQPALACSLKELNSRISCLEHPVILGISSSEKGSCPKTLYSKASWAMLGFELGYGGKAGRFEELRLYADKFKKPMPRTAEFIAAIKAADNYRLDRTLNDYFLCLAGNSPLYDTDMIKLEISRLFDGLFQSFDSYPAWAEIEGMGGKTGFKQSISRLKSIFSIYTVSRNILGNMISILHSQQFNSTNRIVNSAVNIIQKDLSSDISLENVARQLFVNPNYLSRIFSSEMSMSFSRYRAKMRIERARELLLDHRYKIYEIASMVGYTDVVHFAKVFSSFEGISPSEYRDNNAAVI